MTVLAVLRPEPGNAATIARAQAAGFATVSLPLFAVQPVAWEEPDPARFDSLILTSANAIRLGGTALTRLRTLPVLAVGPHTAAAAREAGFDVKATGSGNGAEIAAFAAGQGYARALHVTGRDRMLERGGAIAETLVVYESAAVAVAFEQVSALAGTVALLHSPRAARQLGALLDAAKVDRAALSIAAFSAAIAEAAGAGWGGVAVASAPDDASLFAAVHSLPRATGR